jgi:two-component system NtrC family sensor kinase
MGALLVLAFAPLFFAIASLARASFSQNWERNARGLGRAIAGHVSEARRTRGADEMRGLLEAQLGQSVGAIAVYGKDGKLDLRAGEAPLPQAVPVGREQVSNIETSTGSALVVLVPDSEGSVAALLHTDPSAVRVGPLVQLVALYIGLLGFVLLVFSYFVLTRIVVLPLERLQLAARRVADGARKMSVPRGGGRELIELGSSLATMTTALRAEETLLREKVEELRRAQETVIRGERLASVGRLSAGLAHEIGNPIAAILSFQELLLDGELGDDERDFVERMKRETERVHRILRDLLDFARPAAPIAEAEQEDPRASLRDVIDHVAALLKPQKSFQDVAIELEVDDGLPTVAMHPQRIEQVLLNILLNAADAVSGPDGSIWLKAQSADAGVVISIEDNGGGIEPSVRDRLFEPFVTTKDVGKGTGLGLAVCRGLVESAGGTIEAEEGDEGARFVLTLPHA